MAGSSTSPVSRVAAPAAISGANLEAPALLGRGFCRFSLYRSEVLAPGRGEHRRNSALPTSVLGMDFDGETDMRLATLVLIGALGVGAATGCAQAAPFAPASETGSTSPIIQVYGGCGWGFHPVPGHWSRWRGEWVPPHCATSHYGYGGGGEYGGAYPYGAGRGYEYYGSPYYAQPYSHNY